MNTFVLACSVEGNPKLIIDYRGADLRVGGAVPDTEPTESVDAALEDEAVKPFEYQPDGEGDGAEAADGTPLCPTLSSTEAADQLVAMWRKSGIIGLEDPLSAKDKAGLATFSDRIAACVMDIQKMGSPDLAYNLRGIGGDAACYLQVLADREAGPVAKLSPVFNAVKVSLWDGAGSVLMAMDRCSEVRAKGLTLVVGCREGGPEAPDDFLTDFAVATGAAQLHAGGLGTAEHSCKYTRLLQIADADESLRYVGKNFRS